jgi:hypothetical protein
MVILNEFTDAGLDALSVAEAARGRSAWAEGPAQIFHSLRRECGTSR